MSPTHKTQTPPDSTQAIHYTMIYTQFNVQNFLKLLIQRVFFLPVYIVADVFSRDSLHTHIYTYIYMLYPLFISFEHSVRVTEAQAFGKESQAAAIFCFNK